MEKLYINKEDCCGCSACLNICPKHAIYMKHDEKGYLYPEIREDSCVNCGLCEKVCPLKDKEKNKKEAIEHLAGKLKDAGYIADVDSYIEDIYLRESQGQTGIGHYVAIPHGKSDSVTQVGIAIGKVQDEIEWETLDGNGVKLIFLFAVGNDNENAKTHLRLLAEVARTLGNDDAVEALLNASTVEDLKAVFA